MWLLFALISPFFWAIVHVLDSHCVNNIFEKPWMGITTSAISSFVVLLTVPFILPFFTISIPAWNVILLAIIAGVFIQISQAFYFQALDYSEAGIVAAYWNFTPATLPVLSYLLFGSILRTSQYIGIILLVSASVCFCLIDVSFHARWRSFALMIVASILQAIALLLENEAFMQANEYYIIFLLTTLGFTITGCLPLLLNKVRKIFLKNILQLHSAFKFFVLIEIFNLIALATSQKAIQIGIPSTVAAVESTVPAYTFMFSFLFSRFIPNFKKSEYPKNIVLKFTLVFVMAWGVLLVF